jgi:hypothetical protein
MRLARRRAEREAFEREVVATVSTCCSTRGMLVAQQRHPRRPRQLAGAGTVFCARSNSASATLRVAGTRSRWSVRPHYSIFNSDIEVETLSRRAPTHCNGTNSGVRGRGHVVRLARGWCWHSLPPCRDAASGASEISLCHRRSVLGRRRDRAPAARRHTRVAMQAAMSGSRHAHGLRARTAPVGDGRADRRLGSFLRGLMG